MELEATADTAVAKGWLVSRGEYVFKFEGEHYMWFSHGHLLSHVVQVCNQHWAWSPQNRA